MVSWKRLMLTKFSAGLVLTSASAAKEAIIDARGDVQIPPPSSSHQPTTTSTYGVDVSWPMQHSRAKTKQAQQSYQEYIAACEKQSMHCLDFESDRLEMNLLQPSAMQNYTHAGVAKVPVPPSVLEKLQKFWYTNKDTDAYQQEEWNPANTYVNHWEAPTYLLDMGREDLPEMSASIQWEIVKEVQSIVEAWTKQSVILTSLYGIRAYQRGAILAPHVDRLPLVSSAIINVAQEGVEEQWPLEVIGHDGIAVNITLEPGEMILYESHSVIHGRPYPFRGTYYANLFIHFEPIGHTIRHANRQSYGSDVEVPDHARVAYEKALKFQKLEDLSSSTALSSGEIEDSSSSSSSAGNDPKQYTIEDRLPPYVNPEDESRWKQDFEFEKQEKIYPKSFKQSLGLVNVHSAAADGDVATLKEYAKTDRQKLFLKDKNGWRPLHEAARAGRAKAIEYLIKEGAQVNEKTNNGQGGSPLWWAEKKPDQNKEAIAILKKHGAISLAPGAKKNQPADDSKDKKKVERNLAPKKAD